MIVLLVAAYRRGSLAALPMCDERDVMPLFDGGIPDEVEAAAVLIKAERVFYPKPQ